jgi:lipoate-protein ligase A
MEILDSGPIPCQEAMEKDAELLAKVNAPLLHLYEMEGKPATYGWFTKPQDFLHLDIILKEQISLARRPTGGGIIFHFLDFAFSFLAPKNHPLISLNTLENYKTINSIVMQAIAPLIPKKEFTFIEKEAGTKISNFCMAHPTAFDLLCEGKKIVGAAQRKTKEGILHQGSIAILAPTIDFLNKVLIHTSIATQMENQSFYLTTNPLELPALRQTIKNELIKSFRNTFSK